MKPALPKLLSEIADLAGMPAAIAISSAKGGTRVYIPAKAEDGHWLVKAVGRDAADKIAAQLGGDRYDIPRAGTGAYGALRRKIAKQVHDLDRNEASSREIAEVTGISQRAVHRHRAVHRGGGRKDDPQGSLF